MKHKIPHLDGDKPFNMDLLFLERMNERLTEADAASSANNQPLRYRLLYNIFINCHFKLDKDEQVEMKGLFDAVRDTMKTPAATIARSGVQAHELAVIAAVEQKLDAVHFKLVEYLFKYDIIFLKKRRKMDTIEEFEMAFE